MLGVCGWTQRTKQWSVAEYCKGGAQNVKKFAGIMFLMMNISPCFLGLTSL